MDHAVSRAARQKPHRLGILPYKKMDSPRSIVSFSRPAYWDEIVANGKVPGTIGDTKKRIAKRPPQEHINAAFTELLDNIQFSKCGSTRDI
jgi:hypothetical protein